MPVNLAHSVLLEGFVVVFPPLKTVGLSLGFWRSLCSVYSLLSARASFKEVGMETIFYFGYWIISGASCPKFLSVQMFTVEWSNFIRKQQRGVGFNILLFHSFFKTASENSVSNRRTFHGLYNCITKSTSSRFLFRKHSLLTQIFVEYDPEFLIQE